MARPAPNVAGLPVQSGLESDQGRGDALVLLSRRFQRFGKFVGNFLQLRGSFPFDARSQELSNGIAVALPLGAFWAESN